MVAIVFGSGFLSHCVSPFSTIVDLDNKVHCCRRFFIWLNVVSVFGLRIPSYSCTETFGPMGGKFRKVGSD